MEDQDGHWQASEAVHGNPELESGSRPAGEDAGEGTFAGIDPGRSEGDSTGIIMGRPLVPMFSPAGQIVTVTLSTSASMGASVVTMGQLTQPGQTAWGMNPKSDGMRAGEVIAYRAWKIVNDDELSSLNIGYVWTPGNDMEGNVEEAGVFAFKTEEQARNLASHQGTVCFAYGKVALYGDIVEHEWGYRASFCRIVEIIDGPRILCDIEMLALKYGVPWRHALGPVRGTIRRVRRKLPWDGTINGAASLLFLCLFMVDLIRHSTIGALVDLTFMVICGLIAVNSINRYRKRNT